MSFLEMLDVVNEELTAKGEDPIAFDHDCREGICGTCSIVVNGRPHGPRSRTTACQLHMRSFADGDTLVIEPWRAAAFPVIKDLVVDRGALDRDHRRRRLRLGADRLGPRRQRDPGAEAGRREGDGRGRLHRLRRVRGGLPERLRDAVHGAPRSLSSRSCRRASPSGCCACGAWSA